MKQQIKIGDKVVIKNGRVVTITEQYSTTMCRATGTHGDVLYHFSDIAGVYGQRVQINAPETWPMIEWATE